MEKQNQWGATFMKNRDYVFNGMVHLKEKNIQALEIL
jgi:hypothetical protein